MDIVVAYVLVKFGMLLSRSWSAKLKGTMQMDFSYAPIPIFNQQRRLWRENRLKYMISSKECLENHPIYAADTKMGSTIFFNSFEPPKSPLVMMKEKGDNREIKEEPEISIEQREQWFTMHFDGACNKEGARAGITISTPYFIEQTFFSYKLYFNCTNNIAEYEAFLLGLQILKKMQEKGCTYMETLSLC